jgi:DNA-binding FadR family transcriptional regulator
LGTLVWLSVDRKPKLAEQVAAQIERQIVDRGWPVGQLLGSEAGMAEQYGVSRAVMREATRILEHHLVVSSRRGTGGGLVVMAPDIDAVLPPMAMFLDHQGVSPAQLFESRSVIELAVVELAAERIDEAGIVRLRQALETEEAELTDPHKYLLSHDLHVLIAELSGNPTLRLFIAALTKLSSAHAKDKFATVKRPRALEIGKEIGRAHRRIADAIVAGDAELARKRMLSHLRAITPWLT